MPRRAIAVVGAADCSQEEYAAAYEIGRLIADRGAIVVTGGGSGVMEAASRGARDACGLAVGILPGTSAAEANASVDIAISTGMGELRNGLVVRSAEAVIAVGGEWGTLSEIALAVKMGKPVIGWNTWKLVRDGVAEDGILCASTAAEAVDLALASPGGPDGKGGNPR